VESVETEHQQVIADGREFPYDHLIVALGAELGYFGIPGVQEHAINIKGIAAAEEIRNRVIERYEQSTLSRAEVPDSHPSFVVIGGGATGVEVAAELHALVHDILAPDYPNMNPYRARPWPETFSLPSKAGRRSPSTTGP
jgi:NADH:ubiquinone reductase (H+-translocating)